tara:strand:- start:339 stop:509 length:171 start_codon:yes stop_codon:yes gene_type:complete
MLRLFVALTPIVGAILFPLIIPFVIVQKGISFGVFAALSLSTIWFVAMLRTSEMPH